jgi:hypothetical protein
MFAEAVIELLSNEERMRDMSQNGIECIESYWAIEKALMKDSVKDVNRR